ncbi:hypothetical protein [Halomonas sp. BN3-1]|uniref:hypothetical protein n=1 Tax=Halomonas sp. BN3-1 TaxID=2082393 RepID=UPI000D353ED7|nr:hypothetical protein [Halomonas sp. BN3-1]
MKIKFLATTQSADQYAFSENKVVAYEGDHREEYDLAGFPTGGVFEGSEGLPSGVSVIRGVERVDGELYVTLTQAVIAGQYPGRKAHWRESPIIDAADYDPSICYVIPTGMAGVNDYEIVQGVDVSGNTGWTVRKIETQE